MKAIIAWFRQNIKTRQDVAAFLTASTPVALAMERAPADSVVSITAVLFLCDSVARRNWGWVKQPWVATSLALWFYSVIRACFIPHGASNIFAAFVWVRYIVFAASAATWILTEEKGRHWLARGVMASVLFLSIDALVQYIFGFDVIGHTKFQDFRLTATFNRPIVGITIANLFAPAIFWLLQKKQIRDAAVLAGLGFAAIFLSGERMALLLGLAIVAPWIYFLLRNHKNLWRGLIVVPCLLALLLVVAPLTAKRQIQSTVATIEHFGSSAYGLVWNSALEVGEDFPLFGVGIHQFRNVCPDPRYGPLIDPTSDRPRCFTHAHNIYLEWFSEGGLAGLLGFAGFVTTVFAGLIRRFRVHKDDIVLWGLAAMLTIRLAPFFVSTSFFNNWSAIPFWLYLGWAMSYRLRPVKT
jgi:O-antigen ligase